MRSQALGLAGALACDVLELRAPSGPFSRAPGPAGGPWPDVLITCGRRSAAFSIRLRRASGGRTFTVHIQDPRRPPDRFDLVIAMDHDRRIAGPNVVRTSTALHGVTPERLDAAAQAWRIRLAPLAPFTGVLVGGPVRGRGLDRRQGARLLDALKSRRAGGERLAVVASRRTPPALLRDLAGAFADDPGALVWDRTGDNPYLGVLALADRQLVTGDSVSMVSEALATRAAVEVFDVGLPRFAPFLDALESSGLIGRSGGAPPPVRSGAIDATAWAAQEVRRRLQARTGVSG